MKTNTIVRLRISDLQGAISRVLVRHGSADPDVVAAEVVEAILEQILKDLKVTLAQDMEVIGSLLDEPKESDGSERAVDQDPDRSAQGDLRMHSGGPDDVRGLPDRPGSR